MAERVQVSAGGDYFPGRNNKRFFSTGCTVLDCVLGGGWCLGRVANIVGDKSVGKTLLAIEAVANFANLFPTGKIWYRESEAAFDTFYAQSLGLPIDRVDFGPEGEDSLWQTIEDIYEDIRECIKFSIENDVPGLYIIDSLDAVGARAGVGRDLDQGSFRLDKQKLLSEMFCEIAGELKKAHIAVIIISQVRDKIGFVVGEKHTRSGGKDLDFYASHIIWLSHLKRIVKTIGGVKRAIGVRIKANCKKNKVTVPFGECEFAIRFGYGVDDLVASLDWLEEVKHLGDIDLTPAMVDRFIAESDGLSTQDYRKLVRDVSLAVINAWEEVEGRFKPTRKKYG